MLEINFKIMAVQIITFIVAVFLLWKVAWGPLARFVRQRQEKIKNDMDSASAAKQTAEGLESELKQKLAAIEERASQVISQAVEEGRKVKEQSMASAQQSAQEIHNKSLDQIKSEKNAALEGLKEQVMDISVEIARKLMGASVDKKVHDRMFQEVLKEIELLKGRNGTA